MRTPSLPSGSESFAFGFTQKRNDSLRIRRQMEGGVGVGLDQILQDTCWTHDRIKRTTKVFRHRGFGLAYQRGFRFGACVEDDVATREHRLDVRKASAFERALQLDVLCNHRAYAAKERDITRHRLSLARAAQRHVERRALSARPLWVEGLEGFFLTRVR